MEKNAHFAVVGGFLVLSIVLGVIFLFWLAGAKHTIQSSRYEIRFEGSVSGLDQGGDVRYLGVKIGNVDSITLMPEEPSMVRVVVKIRDDSPIYENTVATLQVMGLTGVAFIELTQGEGAQDRIFGSAEPPYPLIQSKKSDLDKLFTSMPDFLKSTEELLNRASGLLNDDNIENITGFLSNLKDFSNDLPEIENELFKTLRETRETLNEVKKLVKGIAPNTTKAMGNLEQTTRNLENITTRINTLYQDNEDRMNEFMTEGIDELLATLSETQETLIALRNLSQKLDEQPSRLIYKPKSYGVEIQE